LSIAGQLRFDTVVKVRIGFDTPAEESLGPGAAEEKSDRRAHMGRGKLAIQKGSQRPIPKRQDRRDLWEFRRFDGGFDEDALFIVKNFEVGNPLFSGRGQSAAAFLPRQSRRELSERGAPSSHHHESQRSAPEAVATVAPTTSNRRRLKLTLTISEISAL